MLLPRSGNLRVLSKAISTKVESVRVAIVIFVVALTIFALIDCARTSKMPSKISKPAWLALIFLLPVLGPLLWLYFKNQSIFASGKTVTPDAMMDRFKFPGGQKKPKGPLAPDDDPEFLARLEAQNRRRAYEQKRREEEGLTDDELDQDDNLREEDEDDGGLYGGRR